MPHYDIELASPSLDGVRAPTERLAPECRVRLVEPLPHPLAVEDVLKATEQTPTLHTLQLPPDALLDVSDATHAPMRELLARVLDANASLDRAALASFGARANLRDNLVRALEALFVNGRLGRLWTAADGRPFHSLTSLAGLEATALPLPWLLALRGHRQRVQVSERGAALLPAMGFDGGLVAVSAPSGPTSPPSADTPIEQLGFDERVVASLRRAGCRTYTDVVAIPEDQILRLPSMGRKGWVQITTLVRQHPLPK